MNRNPSNKKQVLHHWQPLASSLDLDHSFEYARNKHPSHQRACDRVLGDRSLNLHRDQ
jgi:hypothetical protein